MRRVNTSLHLTALPCLLLACLLLSSAESGSAEHQLRVLGSNKAAQTWWSALPEDAGLQDYGGYYTPEELAALDRALDAINCTRADLMFEKDYGKGHACFPVVRDMLRDPLLIAPFVDGQVRLPNNMRLSDAALNIAFNAFPEEHTRDFILSWSPKPEDTAQGDRSLNPYNVQYEYLMAEWEAILNHPDFLYGFPDDLPAAFREELLPSVAWHAIDGGSVQPDTDISELFQQACQIEPRMLWWRQFHLLQDGDLRLRDFPDDYWPTQVVVKQTSGGRIAVGTLGDDTYTGDFAVLIDPGGNDTYRNCRIGAAYGKPSPELGSGRVAFFADLGGDDLYDCADVDITLGAAVMGVAAFYDLGQGNDRYYGGNVSLGAAMGGVALFYDDGGSDFYSGKVFTQGAAGFGIGIMIDDSVHPAPDVPTDEETPDPIDLAALDNDSYTAWCMAQAFARTRGIALCVNARGNEVYHAGGVYLHAPLFTDRYQSFSQGFAIGERGIDYAGGIALLADYDGNDRYLGDIYNQGVGYWYSAGLLYDGGGNDSYEMTQYGQGSGIHLAVGGLVDAGGHDTYVMHSGLGQGSSHDYASSVLHDRSGNDKYYGTTSSCGTSLTNSAALFIDRSGDDTYAARLDGGFNTGRPARDAGGIGIFVDLAGNDDYLGDFADGASWVNAQYGSGVDVAPVERGSPDPQSSPNPGGLATPGSETVIPEIVSYDGPLTQAVFDELWEIAIRWEVGDNQVIVPAARQRLIAFGPDVLPYVETKMDDAGSLAIRAYVDVLRAFAYVPVAQPPSAETSKTQAAGVQLPAPPQPAETLPLVEALLGRQIASGVEARQIVALSVIGELSLGGAGAAVAGLLDSPDMGLQRRALATLGQLGSHSAEERIIALLHPDTDERLLRSAIVTAAKLKLDCYPQFRTLLDVPKFTARDALVGQLAAQHETYGAAMRDDLLSPAGLSTTALRSLLRVHTRITQPPDTTLLEALNTLSANPDPGLQADRDELLRHWFRLQEEH